MQVGVRQRLVVSEAIRGGFLLGEGLAPAFLPHRNAPEGVSIGDELEVFVFTDKEGEAIATLDVPLVEVGQFAALQVVDVVEHGAYLDWGLDRDLFVPHGLQHRPLRVGDTAVVAVDLDEYDRIYGSTKLAAFLEPAPQGMTPGTEVSLLAYGSNERGTSVVVEGRYNGLVYHSATFKKLGIGDSLTGFVMVVRPDGRVDVALQRNRRAGTDDAREVVWQALVDNEGFLPLHDKSSPAEIKAVLEMSKKRFKKAVGSLYRDRRIRIEDDGIHQA